jgi:hypothetical protein
MEKSFRDQLIVNINNAKNIDEIKTVLKDMVIGDFKESEKERCKTPLRSCSYCGKRTNANSSLCGWCHNN